MIPEHLCVIAGCVPAGFICFGVIEERHTFFNVLVFVHDHQSYTLVCCEYYSRGVFPEGFDGLLLLFGDVVGGPLLFLEVL